MSHLNFASDNVTGASAPVLDALVRANSGPAAAYGGDEWTRRVEARLAELFECEVAVFLVGTGTAANALALSAVLKPYGLCLCHEEAHVAEDECGAPEFFAGGAKLLGVPGFGGLLAPEAVRAALDRLPAHEKQMPAQALTISQATEAGLVYSLDAIQGLGDLARSRGLKLHMDGARFANALVSLGATPADMTWRAGVDILSFGGTKNGCLAGEAIVAFDLGLGDELRFRRKRAGQTFSKGRFLGAQLEGYLADDHWLDNARHANGMASALSDGLSAIPGIRIPWRAEANEVFAILPLAVDRALRQAGAVYHVWATGSLPPGEQPCAGEVLVRLVASFETPPEAVEAVLSIARSSADAHPSARPAVR